MKGRLSKTICGTKDYLAPEILEGKGYGFSCDWWSFGCLLYEMLTGEAVFGQDRLDDATLFNAILWKKPNLSSPLLSNNARDLLSKLLTKKPSQRLTDPEMIKKHPFFSGIDWTLLQKKVLTPPFIPAF